MGNNAAPVTGYFHALKILHYLKLFHFPKRTGKRTEFLYQIMNTSQTNVSSSSQRLLVVDNYRLAAFGIQLVILTFGAVLNLLLIIAIIKDLLKTFKTPSSSLILNIALADILVCVSWIIKIILNLTSHGYRVNKETRDVLFRIWTASIGISPLLYMSLSIERFCSVSYPLWHRVHITTRFCWHWQCTIWIFHIIFETLVSCLVPVMSFEEIMIILLYVGISFLLTQVFYLATYFSLKKQRGRFVKRQDVNEAVLRTMKIRLQREKQFLHTIAIVCFILNFTLLPSLTLLIVHGIYPQFSNQREVFSISMDFLSFSFATNPIVYVWRLPKYKKTFKLLYCKSL